MNQQRLQQIFKQYIDRFEELNTEHREIYKWEIAAEFQHFDVDAPNFVEMLSHMQRTMQNILDNKAQHPFIGLIECAKKPGEEETVREMFRALYAQEVRTIPEKQAAINAFLASYNELKQRYFPESWQYNNDQRSVMTYLFFRYPNHYFAYKASEAKDFADCVEFYEDWGTTNEFRLDRYERMCEQLIEEIKKNDALLATHRSRYENAKTPLHPDENLHILAFDIIYCSQAYGFYADMTFPKINAKARRLYEETVKEANKRYEKLQQAEQNMALLEEAKKSYADAFSVGSKILHKTYGEGKIEESDGLNATVHFSKTNETKKLGLPQSVKSGWIVIEDSAQAEKLKSYESVLGQRTNIAARWKHAMEEFEPYQEYFDGK